MTGCFVPFVVAKEIAGALLDLVSAPSAAL